MSGKYIKSSLTPPWENQKRFLIHYDPDIYTLVEFNQYRKWLTVLLQKLFPDILDLDMTVAFAIIFSLFNSMRVDELPPHMVHVWKNILLRGFLATKDTMPVTTFVDYVQERGIERHVTWYFLTLFDNRRRDEIRTKISLETFNLILSQLPNHLLVRFAENIFRGIKSYQIIPQVFTRTEVSQGVFQMPVPGYELMYHELYAPSPVFLHGLQFSSRPE